MTPIENLHYAIGQLAYAIARADGEVQPKERLKFQNMVAAELRCKDYNFDISEIIFKMMDKEKASTEITYEWAIKQLKINSHYLSPEMKKKFITVIEKIAKAYPPVVIEEQQLIERFRKEIEPLHGDPVYYGRK
jgi:uncharacterized tellurite resistance protein B-like protein